MAVNKARRLFGLGLAAKAVGATPKAAKKAGNLVNEAYGLGEEAIPVTPIKAMRKLNSSLNGIAEARLYRMNRVAGKSRGESLGALALAKKKRQLELKYLNPVKKGKRVMKLDDSRNALNEDIHGLSGFKDKAKRIATGAKTATDMISGKLAF